MNKEFVTYKQALALKELGFDEPCFGYYNYNGTHFFDYKPKTDDKNLTKAPLYQQAFRWFREKYGLFNFINFSGDGFCSGWEDLGNNEHGFENFKTYEEAESTCLDKLIELVRLPKP
jgi:hypothetical protein